MTCHPNAWAARRGASAGGGSVASVRRVGRLHRNGGKGHHHHRSSAGGRGPSSRAAALLLITSGPGLLAGGGGCGRLPAVEASPPPPSQAQVALSSLLVSKPSSSSTFGTLEGHRPRKPRTRRRRASKHAPADIYADNDNTDGGGERFGADAFLTDGGFTDAFQTDGGFNDIFTDMGGLTDGDGGGLDALDSLFSSGGESGVAAVDRDGDESYQYDEVEVELEHRSGSSSDAAGRPKKKKHHKSGRRASKKAISAAKDELSNSDEKQSSTTSSSRRSSSKSSEAARRPPQILEHELALEPEMSDAESLLFGDSGSSDFLFDEDEDPEAAAADIADLRRRIEAEIEKARRGEEATAPQSSSQDLHEQASSPSSKSHPRSSSSSSSSSSTRRLSAEYSPQDLNIEEEREQEPSSVEAARGAYQGARGENNNAQGSSQQRRAPPPNLDSQQKRELQRAAVMREREERARSMQERSFLNNDDARLAQSSSGDRQPQRLARPAASQAALPQRPRDDSRNTQQRRPQQQQHQQDYPQPHPNERRAFYRDSAGASANLPRPRALPSGGAYSYGGGGGGRAPFQAQQQQPRMAALRAGSMPVPAMSMPPPQAHAYGDGERGIVDPRRAAPPPPQAYNRSPRRFDQMPAADARMVPHDPRFQEEDRVVYPQRAMNRQQRFEDDQRNSRRQQQPLPARVPISRAREAARPAPPAATFAAGARRNTPMGARRLGPRAPAFRKSPPSTSRPQPRSDAKVRDLAPVPEPSSGDGGELPSKPSLSSDDQPGASAAASSSPSAGSGASSSSPSASPSSSYANTNNDDGAAKSRAKSRRASLKRTLADDLHETYSTSVVGTLRGDGAARVPPKIFGQTYAEESSAFLTSQYARAVEQDIAPGADLASSKSGHGQDSSSGAALVTEESVAAWTWHTTPTIYETGGGTIAQRKLYGGAQYHRLLESLHSTLMNAPLAPVTSDELALLMRGVSATGGGVHDGGNVLGAVANICRHRMDTLLRSWLDAVTARVEFVLGERSWEVAHYSALTPRPSSPGVPHDMQNSALEAELGSEERNRLEDELTEVSKGAYAEFVRTLVARAHNLARDDLDALVKYVSWEMVTGDGVGRQRARVPPAARAMPSGSSSAASAAATIQDKKTQGRKGLQGRARKVRGGASSSSATSLAFRGNRRQDSKDDVVPRGGSTEVEREIDYELGGDLVGGVLSRGIEDDLFEDEDSLLRGGGGEGSSPSLDDVPSSSASSTTTTTMTISGDDAENDVASIIADALQTVQYAATAEDSERALRTAVSDLVVRVTTSWRREASSMVMGKFNAVVLLGLHESWGRRLREEVDGYLRREEEE